jgi:hypothetical protein
VTGSRSSFALLSVALLGVSLAVSSAGCGGEPPRRPNIMHPLHERRAFDLVSRVFDEAHLTVERGRDVMVTGKPLTVDMAAQGKKYGIAYVTREAQVTLAGIIPKHDANSDALVVVDSDTGDRILVLYERDYMTDDLEGESHSATTIAAEEKIQRDARDFLLRAVRDKWP